MTFDHWASLDRAPRTASVGVQLDHELRLHMRIAERAAGANSIVVFMPAAQAGNDKGQINPLFSRWNWARDYPNSHVVAISDPALYYSEEILAAWYVSPEIDIMKVIAQSVRDISNTLLIPEHAIVVYGSSLGGFGALSLAAILDGASAVCEIPQVDLERWPVPSALRALEDKILLGPLSDHRQRHPEQIDVLARFRAANRVPDMRLITNIQDPLFEDHLQFVADAAKLSTEKIHVGRIELAIENRVQGHQVLTQNEVALMLSSTISALANSSNDQGNK